MTSLNVGTKLIFQHFRDALMCYFNTSHVLFLDFFVLEYHLRSVGIAPGRESVRTWSVRIVPEIYDRVLE